MIASGRPWKFVAGAVIVLAISILLLWIVAAEQEQLRTPELRRNLLTQARVLRLLVEQHWQDLSTPAIQEAVGALREGDVDIALFAADGTPLIEPASGSAATIRDRPEVQRARLVGSGTATGEWGVPPHEYAMVAVAVGPEKAPLGVLWVGRPVWIFVEDPAAFVQMLAVAASVAAAATVAMALVALRVRRRLFQRVLDTARSLSSGDLADIPQVSGEGELAELAATLRALRTRLASQLGLIDGQRRMLQSLVDQLREGVIVARADGRIAMINPAAVRLLDLGEATSGEETRVGRSVEAIIPLLSLQRLLTEFDAAHRDDGEKDSIAAGAVAGVYADRAAPASRLEVPSARGPLHLLARGSDLVLADADHPQGATVGRVVVLTDITELQRTIQMRTDFVANASHELRTPLSTIRAAVETLLTMDLAAERPAAMQFLTKVDRQSARLEQMVADLLDLSRLESPAERFEPERVEIRRLLQDTHARFADALERKELRWRTEVEPGDLTDLHANPHLLRLVLDNLVDNAIKFTERGGEICLRLRRTLQTVDLEVSDTGCGIPPDDQTRVFERFYQVQRSRSGPERGTGLGLSIVRHAVGAMRGQVQLRSELGRGTSVTVTIPRPALGKDG